MGLVPGETDVVYHFFMRRVNGVDRPNITANQVRVLDGRRAVLVKLTRYDEEGIVRDENFSSKISYARVVVQILASNLDYVSLANPVLLTRLRELDLPPHNLLTTELRFSLLFRDISAKLAALGDVMHVGGPAGTGGKELDSTDGRCYQLAVNDFSHKRFDTLLARLRRSQCRERGLYRQVYEQHLFSGAEVFDADFPDSYMDEHTPSPGSSAPTQTPTSSAPTSAPSSTMAGTGKGKRTMRDSSMLSLQEHFGPAKRASTALEAVLNPHQADPLAAQPDEFLAASLCQADDAMVAESIGDRDMAAATAASEADAVARALLARTEVQGAAASSSAAATSPHLEEEAAAPSAEEEGSSGSDFE